MSSQPSIRLQPQLFILSASGVPLVCSAPSLRLFTCLFLHHQAGFPLLRLGCLTQRTPPLQLLTSQAAGCLVAVVAWPIDHSAVTLPSPQQCCLFLHVTKSALTLKNWQDLIPALRQQRLADLEIRVRGQPRLHSEFQGSQDYPERPCLGRRGQEKVARPFKGRLL